MKQDLGLKILGHILKWDDTRARDEFSWLRLMSRLKYDDYRDFRAGARFIESLATWLQQFEPEDRETAYEFVKNKLVYIGYLEMQRLVERFYPETVQPRLLSDVAKDRKILACQVWSDPQATKKLKELRRKTLFMGLSDGSRTDILRHANVGVLSNEQIVVTNRLDEAIWKSLLGDLKKDYGKDARFSCIYLIDDFVGSGTTLLRYDKEEAEWTGKLPRFMRALNKSRQRLRPDELLEDEWNLVVHHHLATSQAVNLLQEKYDHFRQDCDNQEWFHYVEFGYGHKLGEQVRLRKNSGNAFNRIVEKYYDKKVEQPRKKHLDVSGINSLKYGYAECGLSLILEHNTPNNTLALLWIESPETDSEGHSMRPLFRRRDRHI